MGNWSVDVTDPNAGAKSEASGRHIFVYRFAEGGWRIEDLHDPLCRDIP